MFKRFLVILLALLLMLSGCTPKHSQPSASLQQALDAFDTCQDAYMVIDGNVPAITDKDKALDCFEYYSDMDAYNRCGYAFACVCKNTLPTEERGSIGQVRPTGWQTVKYDIVDGKYLYNRCHLIGYQLSAENANPYNLITGTRYFNTQGMLPFENKVAEYIKETGNRVLYRVTPVFLENEMVARGVHMEAWSIEDNGKGICFSVLSITASRASRSTMLPVTADLQMKAHRLRIRPIFSIPTAISSMMLTALTQQISKKATGKSTQAPGSC